MTTPGEIVDEAVGRFKQGDWSSSIVADKAVAYLDEKHPGILSDWLLEHSRAFLARYIGDGTRYERHRRQALAARTAFAQSAEAYLAGQESAFDAYLVINDEGIQRRIGDMTGLDWVYVADEYAYTQRISGLMQQFARALARKVGKRRTQDVLTPQQYDGMFRRIVGTTGEEESANGSL